MGGTEIGLEPRSIQLGLQSRREAGLLWPPMLGLRLRGVIVWGHLQHFDVGQVEGRGAVGEASVMPYRVSQVCTPR